MPSASSSRGASSRACGSEPAARNKIILERSPSLAFSRILSFLQSYSFFSSVDSLYKDISKQQAAGHAPYMFLWVSYV